MEDTRTFEELLISLIGGAEETDAFNSTRTTRGLKHALYFVRNIGDVMNLNLKDEDFRRIVGTFYTDMINSVMGEE